MVALKHFVTLENSMAAAIRPQVATAGRALISEVARLVEAGKFSEAHAVTDRFTLHGAVEAHRPKLEELAVSALLFGAHHVTGTVGTTSFVKGTKEVPHELKSGHDQLAIIIERNTVDHFKGEHHYRLPSHAINCTTGQGQSVPRCGRQIDVEV
jgi:hypothetical protein